MRKNISVLILKATAIGLMVLLTNSPTNSYAFDVKDVNKKSLVINVYEQNEEYGVTSVVPKYTILNLDSPAMEEFDLELVHGLANRREEHQHCKPRE